MTDRIEIYDTTLRDGSQGEGVNFSVDDKCRVAEQLDALGVDFIEGGWPGSNPRDLAFFERVRDLKLTRARVAAFGATRRHTLSCDDDPSIQSLARGGDPGRYDLRQVMAPARERRSTSQSRREPGNYRRHNALFICPCVVCNL